MINAISTLDTGISDLTSANHGRQLYSTLHQQVTMDWWNTALCTIVEPSENRPCQMNDQATNSVNKREHEPCKGLHSDAQSSLCCSKNTILLIKENKKYKSDQHNCNCSSCAKEMHVYHARWSHTANSQGKWFSSHSIVLV